MMTFEQLRIFVAVAEELHFTKAAARLNLTQPAVSAAIAALENAHQVRLFHRQGKRVMLSDAGALLLPEARAILLRVGQAGAMLGELSGLRRGALTVMASQTAGTYWLPPLLRQFSERYPGVELSLTIGNTAQVAEAVHDGAADVGLVEGRIRDPALESRAYPGDELVIVVDPAHPFARRGRLAPTDIPRIPWIVRETGSGTRDLFETALRDTGVDLADLRIVLTVPNGEAIRAAVLGGGAAACVSNLVVAEDIRCGRLCALDYPLPEREFTLLRHKERHVSAAAAAFMAVLDGFSAMS